MSSNTNDPLRQSHTGAEPNGSASDIVAHMARSFSDHPGFLITDHGFEVLHANWPAYPKGHGLDAALLSLSDYPDDTEFYSVDSIDHCTLFLVDKKPERGHDIYSAQSLHVAIWDEDVLRLSRQGLIERSSPEARGPLEEIRLHEAIVLTATGRSWAVILELTADVHRDLLDRAMNHLRNRHYDTAIRDASVLLEGALKNALGTGKFGQQLVDEYCSAHGALMSLKMTNAQRLAVRAAFRRFFKYVRNEFAHNATVIDLMTACRLLRQCSQLYEIVMAVGGKQERPDETRSR